MTARKKITALAIIAAACACMMFTGCIFGSHVGIYDMEQKKIMRRVYDDGKWRECIVHAHPDEDVFATLQFTGNRTGVCFRKRDKDGKLLEKISLPYFYFSVDGTRRLSPDKSKLIAETSKELTLVVFHENAPPELRTFSLSCDAIRYIHWVSNHELLVMSWDKVPARKPTHKNDYDLDKSVYVYDIRTSKKKMIADVDQKPREVFLSDDRKSAAIFLTKSHISNFNGHEIVTGVKVKIFDFEQFKQTTEFDVPQLGFVGVEAAWLNKGKTLAVYDSLNPKIYFHYDMETQTLTEKKYEIPAGWKDCWVYHMYDRFWIVQKDGGVYSRTKARYLYDTQTGEYTRLGGDYMNATSLFAGHLLVSEY